MDCLYKSFEEVSSSSSSSRGNSMYAGRPTIEQYKRKELGKDETKEEKNTFHAKG